MPNQPREAPAAQAANAAPNWCEAKTQPKTIPTRSRPKCSAVSAIVGGTVATQSSP